MRILILGGLGFIGSHTAAALRHQGHSVGVLDCFHQYNSIPDGEYFNVLAQRKAFASPDHIFEGRIEDESYLKKVFAEYRPEVVLHLATYPNARMVQRDAVDATNNMVGGTRKVLAACTAHRVRRLVFASSSMVYGEFGARVPNEKSRTRPKTQYGILKLEGEKLCRRMARKTGLELVILRPSALYGPRDIIVRVISHMAIDCVRHGRITVQGENRKLDFSFVEDVAQAFVLAALHPDASGQTFNCTRGRGRTLLEAAEIVRATLGYGFIELQEAETFYPSRGTLDSDKLKALGWDPSIDIESGIPAYLQWFLEQDHVRHAGSSFEGTSALATQPRPM